MTESKPIIMDLIAEGDELDRLLRDLDDAGWRTPTPAPGWTVAHQVAHLAATFRMAALAVAAPDRFTAMTAQLGPNFTANVDHALAEFVAEPPAALFSRWRAERARTEQALASVSADLIVPWLVRPLPASVLAAAGMMELFGHGQDIADALGHQRRYTDRIGHLVAFGVRTWDFGYATHGLTVPAEPMHFALRAPSGTLWEFGPADAQQRVSGPAADFCLLVTRRRHRDDLALRAEGDEADRWLSIAQAYRGPAGEGRRPGQFATAAEPVR
ncbi:TIGR03084 family metal-binding protein [Catenuloplanes sp. NPDC051500]|uniref:TIGR03084 family metal-binding protein n=1 Tax=Catenuloplanes sp. NPDC051500 TaxID=3363959 RepID=UPI0037A415AA